MDLPIPPRVAAACTLGGGLAFAISDLLRRVVEPSNTADAASTARLAHEHAGAWQLAGWCAVLATFLLVPAALAAMSLARERGRTLTRLGGTLLTAGALALMAHTVVEFALPAMRGSAGVDAATVKALDEAGYPPLLAMILVFILGFTVGLVLLLVGLRRAGVVPVWAVVAALVAVVTGSSGGVLAGWVGLAAWVATLGPVAWAHVRRPQAPLVAQRQASRATSAR